MKGPDGKLQSCYPILFSIAMDYPESCVFALVYSGTACPVCTVLQEKFDDLSLTFSFWDPISMSRAIHDAQKTKLSKGDKAAEIRLQKIGLMDMKVCINIFLIYS